MTDLIKEIEDHTGEALQCSKHFRFLLSESIKREIKKRDSKLSMIDAIISNDKISIYDTTEKKTIYRHKS